MTLIKLRIFASGFSNYILDASNLYFKYTIPRGNRILHCNKVYMHRRDILCKISHTYPGISPRRWIHILLPVYWQFQQNQARCCRWRFTRYGAMRGFHIRKYCVMLKIAAWLSTPLRRASFYARDFLRNSAPLTGDSTLPPYRHYFRSTSAASGILNRHYPRRIIRG